MGSNGTGPDEFRARIQQEFSSVVDNFTKLVKSSNVVVHGSMSREQASYPGELQEVYAEKMLLSCKSILEVSRALKTRCIVNDVEQRNMDHGLYSSSIQAQDEKK